MTKEQAICLIKSCGRDIIDNAENIVNSVDKWMDIEITINISPDCAASITTTERFIGDNIIKCYERGLKDESDCI